MLPPIAAMLLLPLLQVQADVRLGVLEARAGWQLLDRAPEHVGEGERAEWSRVGASLVAAGAGPHAAAVLAGRGAPEIALEVRLGPRAAGLLAPRSLIALDAEGARTVQLGPRLRLLDDLGRADARRPEQSFGALLGLAPARGLARAAPGAWRELWIREDGGSWEHWIDGARALSVPLETLLEHGQGPTEGHGVALLVQRGPIELRRLRARDLGEPQRLLAAGSLEGWRELGDAIWELDGEGVLTGRAGGGGQSFLASEASYGDFVLELDVRTVGPGNSGIQLRSHVRPDGRMAGYQAEVDPSARAWSGGLYDEGRRGWLATLAGDGRARSAFRHGEWNRYRIECVGPRIRIWIDGVPTADLLDPLSMEGQLAFQVHSGNDCHVQFRDARLWELGRARWQRLHLHVAIGEHGDVYGAVQGREGAVALRWREGDTWTLVWGSGIDALEGPAPSGRPLVVRHGRVEIDPAAAASLAPPDARRTVSGEPLEEGEHELVVMLYGGRMSLHAGGALVAERHGLELGPDPFLTVRTEATPAGSGPALESLRGLQWDLPGNR